MLAIQNVTLVMPNHFIPDGVLLAENGKIVNFGRHIPVPHDATVVNGEGLYAGPGLIDIHTHADGDTYFYENPGKVSATLLRHGVTSVLPALYYNLDKTAYLSAIDTIDAAVQDGSFPNFAGYYMEGPYLNPKYGCDREHNPWRGAICEEDYAEILAKVTDTARVWCVAPERDGIMQFVQDVKARIPNIVFSVAHSEATPAEIERLLPYGLELSTHHTNATGTLENYPECRGVCVDEAVNYNTDIYAEIISDFLGIHVHPYMQRLLVKIKGKDKIILISDACAFDGPPIPGCEEATDICFDHSGEIAGSKLTLDVACRNMLLHTGCSLCDIFCYASRNPAKLLRLEEKGEIRIGNDADIVLIDHNCNVKKIFLKGELQHANTI